MNVRSFLSVVTLAAFAAGIGPAAAVVLDVSNYSMLNGNGVAVFGDNNYWDGNYTGSGIKTGIGADNAPLSGGVGALTNSVIGTTGWAGLTGITPNSNLAGTGLYVGWKYFDPTITFHLAQLSRVFSIDVYADYAYGGLVGPPQTITINGITYSGPSLTVVPISSTDARFSVSFLGGIVGSTFTVQPHAGGFGADADQYNIDFPNFPIPGNKEPWMMVSEVQFNGEAVRAVPEPSTWAMMLIGFAAIGYAAHRRAKKLVVVADA
jgi:hypothetical protein